MYEDFFLISTGESKHIEQKTKFNVLPHSNPKLQIQDDRPRSYKISIPWNTMDPMLNLADIYLFLADLRERN